MNVRRGLVATTSTLAAIAMFVACDSSDLVVGDDTKDGVDAFVPDGSVLPEGSGGDATSDTGGDVIVESGKPDVDCPTLSPPAPGFCDGGPTAATFNPTTGCTAGFVCAPVACTSAGGVCTGLAPSACPDGHFGDATRYSCGAGVGVGCCLPGE